MQVVNTLSIVGKKGALETKEKTTPVGMVYV